MKISRLISPAFVGLTMLFSSSLLLAQTDNDSGFYIGGAYGVANFNDSEFDDDNTVPQLFLGLQLNSFFGIEASYMDFGSYGGDVLSAETDGFGLALTGTLPLTQSFSVFAKAGQFWWDTDVSAFNFSNNYSGRELFYGLGVSFSMTQNLDLRLTYERLDMDMDQDEIGPIANGNFNSEVDVISLGLKFMF